MNQYHVTHTGEGITPPKHATIHATTETAAASVYCFDRLSGYRIQPTSEARDKNRCYYRAEPANAGEPPIIVFVFPVK